MRIILQEAKAIPLESIKNQERERQKKDREAKSKEPAAGAQPMCSRYTPRHIESVGEQ